MLAEKQNPVPAKESAVLNKSRKFNIKNYYHWLYLLVIPAYMLVFCIDERVVTENYFVMDLPLDNLIPFLEAFIIPYFAWYPFMIGVGAYLIFKDVKGFKKYMFYIFVSFMVSVFLYLIFPNGQGLRPDITGNENIFTGMIHILYTIDTPTNVCPSLHVVGSMAAIFAVFDCEKLKNVFIRIAAVVVGAAIIVSIVFVKQHSVHDIFISVPYSFLMYFVTYKWLSKKLYK